MKTLLLTILGLSAGFASAGILVPGLDDSNAIATYTTARAGVINEVADNTAGTMTLAARFNIDASQMTGGPVIVIENGGTSNGYGIYIADGKAIFVAKNNDKFALAESLNDADYTNKAMAVTIGNVVAGCENVVYASMDLNTKKIYTSINCTQQSFDITGLTSTFNQDGNRSVSFLGAGTLTTDSGSRGSLGGLSESDINPALNWLNAVNMVQTEGYNNQLGQVFSVAVPEPATISFLALGALALKRRK
ncbi:MAG: hypothetical protein JW745_03185 [Sedimentisphaerales bacterium]|nr:hypothetical protein [Sedimentisphaerales bacterium]MBN2842295.1 hypothetical protein [Sedimentisphaerales bacterium]